MKPTARGSLEMQDLKNRQKVAIWAPSHTVALPCECVIRF